MAANFVELHEQVTASTTLLDSLQSFLSTFQRDLSAVSEQIANLQLQSKDIDARVQSRKKIEGSLDNLIGELCMPPTMARVILDAPVDEAWFEATDQLEQIILSLQPRSKLRAAKDLTGLTEGLRIVAATKLRSFFLDSLTPIRSSMSANLPVLQSSFLSKYAPLYAFLRRWAPEVADEIQAAYVATVRTYYETGFRRYTRSLGQINARNTTKSTPITVPDKAEEELDLEQISHNASVFGAGVTLAFMVDNKSFTEPHAALFRSAMMVLLDNATVEWAFLERFFPSKQDGKAVDDKPSESNVTQTQTTGQSQSRHLSTTMAWNQIMEPCLQHCDRFTSTLLTPPPSPTPLLTCIKLLDSIILEAQVRGCNPLEGFLMKKKMEMWPVFQKEMHAVLDGLKKVANGAGGGLLKSGVEAGVVDTVIRRYLALFVGAILLCSEEEGMVFSNLTRLREEVLKLITNSGNQFKSAPQKGEYLRGKFGSVVGGLVKHGSLNTHPKAQAELSFWRHKESEVRHQSRAHSQRQRG